MPPGRLLYVDTENPSRIHFGVLPNTTISIPSVFYEAQCIIKRSDPVLDPIDTIDLTLAGGVADDDELAQQFEQELQHVDNCLQNLRHAVIQYMDSCQAVDIFEGWLRSRQNATRKMETLLCLGWHDSDGNVWASHLMQTGLMERATSSRTSY
jgi:hypothetical protein